MRAGVRLGKLLLLVLGRAHALQVRAPAQVRLGEPEVEVGAQRPGDLGRDQLPAGLPGDPPDHLADQVAKGDGLISAGRARREQRFLRGEQAGDLLPVVVVSDAGRHRQAGQPGLVAHDRTDRDACLAGLAELRPVPGDGRVGIQFAPVHQQVRTQRRHGLGGGPHVRQRVLLPRAGPGRVRPAGPQVHHRPAADDHRGAGTDLAAFGEVRRERLAHRLEARLAGPVYLGRPVAHAPSRIVAPQGRARPDHGIPGKMCLLLGVIMGKRAGHRPSGKGEVSG